VKRCSFNQEFNAPLLQSVDTAAQEVFLKTLGFFCALVENGCPFNPELPEMKPTEDDRASGDGEAIEEEEEEVTMPGSILYQKLCDIRSPESQDLHCKGRLVFRKDQFGRSFIQYIFHCLLYGFF